MSYQRINWQDSPSTDTPINANNLNKMDGAIYEIDGAVSDLQSDVSYMTVEINNLVVSHTHIKSIISDEFDEENTYMTGDYCIYDNTLYRFTSDKSSGEWDNTVVMKTNVMNEISALLNV